LSLLHAAGADVNAVADRGMTPFLAACRRRDNRSTLETLVSLGADIDATVQEGGRKGQKALHLVARYGSADMAQYLLELGMDVDIQQEGTPRTPLFWAAQCGAPDTMLDMVQLLVRSGARIDAESCPLHGAAFNGRVEVFEWLLDSGADPGLVDRQGMTILHRAAGARPPRDEDDRLKMVQRALELGVDQHHQNGDGSTALDLAREAGYERIVVLLGGTVEAEEEPPPATETDPTRRLLWLWKQKLKDGVERNDPISARLYELAQAPEDWEAATRGDTSYLVHKRRPLHVSVAEDDPYACRGLSCSTAVGGAGGIAQDVGLGKLTKRQALDFFPELDRCKSFPRPFFALQRTPHGTPLGYNRHGVFMLDQEMNFRRVGSFSKFTDYCAYQTLEGRSWYQAFRQKKDLEEYELEWIDPWDD
jgi:hypothetical protein